MNNIEYTIGEWQAAIETGNGASSVVIDLVDYLTTIPCQRAIGPEGLDTYPECGECPICIAKEYERRMA